MSEVEATRPANVSFERHAQTALVLLVVALLGWVGLTVNRNQLELAKLTIQVENLNDTVTTPPARLEDLVRRVDMIEAAVLADRREEANDGRD